MNDLCYTRCLSPQLLLFCQILSSAQRSPRKFSRVNLIKEVKWIQVGSTVMLFIWHLPCFHYVSFLIPPFKTMEHFWKQEAGIRQQTSINPPPLPQETGALPPRLHYLDGTPTVEAFLQPVVAPSKAALFKVRLCERDLRGLFDRHFILSSLSFPFVDFTKTSHPRLVLNWASSSATCPSARVHYNVYECIYYKQ